MFIGYAWNHLSCILSVAYSLLPIALTRIEECSLNASKLIGDSHEYGLNPEPFDKAQINNYILDYLKTFVKVPTLEIAEIWHGVYAKLPGKTEFIIAHPESGVTVVNALSGAGMTLSFGLAEEVITNSY